MIYLAWDAADERIRAISKAMLVFVLVFNAMLASMIWAMLHHQRLCDHETSGLVCVSIPAPIIRHFIWWNPKYDDTIGSNP